MLLRETRGRGVQISPSHPEDGDASELPTGHALHYEWKLVDRNGDGVITAQEFRRWR